MSEDNFTKFASVILLPSSIGYIAGKVARGVLWSGKTVVVLGLCSFGYTCYKNKNIESTMEEFKDTIYHKGYELTNHLKNIDVDNIKEEMYHDLSNLDNSTITAFAIGGATFCASFSNKI